MNTKQLINGIIDLDNENKALRGLLNKTGENVTIKPTILDEIKEELFLYGLKYSISEHFTPFVYPEGIYNHDTKKFISFDAWLEGITIDKYNRRYLSDKIQDNLSNKEIIELYKPYLKSKYDQLVKVKQTVLDDENNESCES